MMLAYQPVRTLSSLNIVVNQGLSAAKRILPIVDTKNSIVNSVNAKKINIIEGKVNLKNINFRYV